MANSDALARENETLKQAIREINKLVRIPSKGRHAYTHFAQDFTDVRTICAHVMLECGEVL